MLNLRQINVKESKGAYSDRRQVSRFTTPLFNTPSVIIGNAGEPLDHGQAERYVYEEDRVVNAWRSTMDESWPITDTSAEHSISISVQPDIPLVSIHNIQHAQNVSKRDPVKVTQLF